MPATVLRRLAAVLLCLFSLQAAASADRERVLVAGGTGGTGRQVVAQLLEQDRYSVRVLTRDAVRARASFGDRVEYAQGDVRDPESLPAALQGVAYVIGAVGSNSRRDPSNSPEVVDFGGTRNLARAARAAGVKHFVLVSSQGVTDVRNPLNQWLDNILVWKFLGEDALRRSGVPYTIVRPSGLKDEPGGRYVIVAQGDVTPVQPTYIPRADVAAFCVAALGRADALGKTIEITGDPSRPRQDLAAEFARLKTDAPPAQMPGR